MHLNFFGLHRRFLAILFCIWGKFHVVPVLTMLFFTYRTKFQFWNKI